MNVSGKHFGVRRHRAFTLIELIVVMTLLIVVISFAAPSLAGFFRGRAVQAEARRMLSLSRQGQSRAASEGVPMILWVDIAQRSYGLEADSSYGNGNDDPKAVEYKLDSNVTLEIGASDTTKSSMISGNTLFGSGQSTSQHSSLPQIRFQPDGGIEESSPESFRFADRDGGSLWVAQSRNRLNYEVRTQTEQQNARR
jgi:prepilin-type N-terminal cleavage/methylation domain-containing protein